MNLEEMSFFELRRLATEKGVKNSIRLTKPKLIKAIQEKEAAQQSSSSQPSALVRFLLKRDVMAGMDYPIALIKDGGKTIVRGGIIKSGSIVELEKNSPHANRLLKIGSLEVISDDKAEAETPDCA
jgi:hypothetical protein